jgi:hypothetical protein
MDEEDGPRSLLEVLRVAYGAIAVVVGLVVVSTLAVIDADGSVDEEQAPRVVRTRLSPTPDAGARGLGASAAMTTTTYYLVYSQQQARILAGIQEKAVPDSSSRRSVLTFAPAVVLLVATGEDSIAAQDVIDQAYVDYFEGRGPWVNIVDTATWCSDGSAISSGGAVIPSELALAIAASCSSP